MRMGAMQRDQMSPSEKRQWADALREKLVRDIESLEKTLQWETSEASRLKTAAQEADSAISDSSTAGQIVGLINKGAALKMGHSASIHEERSNRLLTRIDELTTKLGILSETDDFSASDVPVPLSSFRLSIRDGSGWRAGDASLASGTFKWTGSGESVECKCSELNSAKPEKEEDSA